MTPSSNSQLKAPAATSPANRREERERAEAEALAQVASTLRERQNKSRKLRELRLAQSIKK